MKLKKYKVAAFNVENMRRMFRHDHIIDKDKSILLSFTIKKLAPHILGVIEASDKIDHHKKFLFENGLKYKFVKSERDRGKQDLVFYYKAHFEPIEIDCSYDFFDEWTDDIDEDGIREVYDFRRRPFEVVFKNNANGKRIRIILVANKSKGVFSRGGIHDYHFLSLANRKRLVAQAKRIRDRIEILMKEDPETPLIVMGDFNDDPGLDAYERQLGKSALETIMGSLYYPERIFHNTLWHLTKKQKISSIWTTEFPDSIVQNTKLRRVWIDHIFVSPAMLKENSEIRYVNDSGKIYKSKLAKDASDHYPVYCLIEM